MIVLIGESASGKSTVERELCNKYKYERIISYTTRPPRKGEIQGVDYYFIAEDEFVKRKNEDYFAEHTMYRDWYYGTARSDCTINKVIVANPHGLRQLKKIFGSNIKSFYLKVDEKERLIRIAKRGDNVLECFRRIISDQGVFQNIEDDCDYVIDCDNLMIGEIVEKIYMLEKDNK